MTAQPSPAERAAAWQREDPDELRRAADEWESIGHHAYADYLRRYADGDRSRYMRPPW